jgi:hypothetical protein
MSWVQGRSTSVTDHFTSFPEEEAFMKYLASVFSVTFASRWRTHASEYSYYILKPHRRPAERYGLPGEVLALYAPYQELQARSLIDVNDIQQRHKERVHPVWNILIADSPQTKEQLDDLTAGKDLEVYSIPISRQELEAKPSAEFLHARIEEYIHGRDLFAFQSALQSDTFFFGRKGTVESIVGQIENRQNFGLFGLRKTGKTSVLLAVERYLAKLGNYKTIHIDCQSPGIYLMQWNALLARISSQLSGEQPVLSSPGDQVALFERVVMDCKDNILLIFDEVENISFDLAPVSHWNEDFLHFWGAIRAIHQSSQGKLTFGVAGVNPHVFELPLVQGRDNPILLGVSPFYLHPLDRQATREMVRTIGRYMGLDFEESAYDWLFGQYGGHPLLTRKVCSLVYQKANKGSGLQLKVSDFSSSQAWLDEQLGKDIMNMLVVLAQHYPDEMDNLILLAGGHQEWLQEMRMSQPDSLSHILGYEIVSEQANRFTFVIGSLERFLMSKGEEMKRAVRVLHDSTTPTSYDELPEPTRLELWTRLNVLRNTVEPRLRTLLHRALLFKYAEKKALQQVLTSLAGYSLAQIFNGESKALFFKDLTEIALREWDLVQHIFGDKKAFQLHLERLNGEGRADAHANPITESTVLQLEAIGRELLEKMAPYLA